MSMVQQAIEVGAPLHTVYEQLATFENYPKFMTGVQQVTPIDSDRTHWVMDVDGRRREFDAQIIERSPDQRLAWSTMGGPRLAETITLRPMGEMRTQVVAQLEADAAFLLPGDRDAEETLNRRLKRDLTTFKGLVESGVMGTARTRPVSPATVAARIRRRGAVPRPGAGTAALAEAGAEDNVITPGRRLVGRSGPLSGGVGGGAASMGKHAVGAGERGDAVIHEDDRGGSRDY